MQRLSHFFIADKSLKALSDDAQQLQFVQKIWADIVPKPFDRYTHAGLIAHKRLTVYSSSGAVAAKIKLMLPSLIKKLQNQGLEVTSIRVEVQAESSHADKKRPERILPEQAISSLNSLAETLEESALKASIERLISRKNASKA